MQHLVARSNETCLVSILAITSHHFGICLLGTISISTFTRRKSKPKEPKSKRLSAASVDPSSSGRRPGRVVSDPCGSLSELSRIGTHDWLFAVLEFSFCIQQSPDLSYSKLHNSTPRTTVAMMQTKNNLPFFNSAYTGVGISWTFNEPA